MNLKKITFLTVSLYCLTMVPAQNPKPGETDYEIVDESEGVPFGEPIFPKEMYVSLWNDSVPICYQHSDTIPDTDYGRCINFNQLEFNPDGEKGIVMTWKASAAFDNGFSASCTYIYQGTRDLNVVQLTSRHVEGEESDESLDPEYQGSIVNLFSPTLLRFNNRTFHRMHRRPGEDWVREDTAE